jgi:hypothetical protein
MGKRAREIAVEKYEIKNTIKCFEKELQYGDE